MPPEGAAAAVAAADKQQQQQQQQQLPQQQQRQHGMFVRLLAERGKTDLALVNTVTGDAYPPTGSFPLPASGESSSSSSSSSSRRCSWKAHPILPPAFRAAAAQTLNICFPGVTSADICTPGKAAAAAAAAAAELGRRFSRQVAAAADPARHTWILIHKQQQQQQQQAAKAASAETAVSPSSAAVAAAAADTAAAAAAANPSCSLTTRQALFLQQWRCNIAALLEAQRLPEKLQQQLAAAASGTTEAAAAAPAAAAPARASTAAAAGVQAVAEERLQAARRRLAERYAFLIEDRQQQQQQAASSSSNSISSSSSSSSSKTPEEAQLAGWHWPATLAQQRETAKTVEAALTEQIKTQRASQRQLASRTHKLPRLLWRLLAEAKEVERQQRMVLYEQSSRVYGRRDVFADWSGEHHRMRRAFLLQLQQQQQVLQRQQQQQVNQLQQELDRYRIKAQQKSEACKGDRKRLEKQQHELRALQRKLHKKRQRQQQRRLLLRHIGRQAAALLLRQPSQHQQQQKQLEQPHVLQQRLEQQQQALDDALALLVETQQVLADSVSSGDERAAERQQLQQQLHQQLHQQLQQRRQQQQQQQQKRRPTQQQQDQQHRQNQQQQQQQRRAAPSLADASAAPRLPPLKRRCSAAAEPMQQQQQQQQQGKLFRRTGVAETGGAAAAAAGERATSNGLSLVIRPMNLTAAAQQQLPQQLQQQQQQKPRNTTDVKTLAAGCSRSVLPVLTGQQQQQQQQQVEAAAATKSALKQTLESSSLMMEEEPPQCCSSGSEKGSMQVSAAGTAAAAAESETAVLQHSAADPEGSNHMSYNPSKRAAAATAAAAAATCGPGGVDTCAAAPSDSWDCLQGSSSCRRNDWDSNSRNSWRSSSSSSSNSRSNSSNSTGSSNSSNSSNWRGDTAAAPLLQRDERTPTAAAAANGTAAIGKYAALLSAAAAAAVLSPDALQQLSWLDERRTDRTVVPPSQDPYRDGSLFTECLHLETSLFALLRLASKDNSPPDLVANILQSNSPFSNFHQLRRGYRLLNMLGRGGFAEVWEVFDPLTCSVAAAKLHVLSSVKREKERLKIVKRVQNEIEIHKDIRPHPHIVEMKACFEMGNDVLASILQFCEGGDLDHYLKISGPLEEPLAARWIRQILQALHYLKHQPNGSIYHLDVKPGNVLLQEGDCKLADFGLSCFVPKGESRPFTGGGTLWYQPPECLLLQQQQQQLRQQQQRKQQQQIHPGANGEQIKDELAATEQQPQQQTPLVVLADEKIDIWAVGCILYEMLFNKRPFCRGLRPDQVDPSDQIISDAKKGLYIPTGPRKISEAAKDMLRRLLAYDPTERLTLEEALTHSFLQRQFEGQQLASRIEEALLALEKQ
ncbi:Tyrosine kinase-like (TKL) protein, putative [Eimeria tenella]|uniref:Tyrosine kinase-like (TKL) protein, putative n=1 Tax=Eimeria tenella TaxID=5802 RepID=U6KZ36_EIMTE|nr:Tyrosine kinase-like (TKL) protein, putative [Eimeria tenella]CDJ40770.1 Tyrosine kinase-like (TKL) protein, putative [Eimeria tenella]|eukprot:XP_013231520.1 Tyrosine kinase-like (TKL) protein, putative [Eimeria tenella]